MDVKMPILLVEDDRNFGLVLKDYLSMNGFDVTLAKNGIEGYEAFISNSYSLCILDVMMPYKDGFTLAKEIRQRNRRVPIIFLTARSMKEDIMKGYHIGADDYLTKPFDSEVLLMKIRAIFQRKLLEGALNPKQTEFQLGDFLFDSKAKTIKYQNEEPEKVQPKVAELLRLLLLYKNDLMPRDVALSRIWREDNYFTSRSMDVTITQLRKLLKRDPNVEVANVHGKGFLLTVKTEEIDE